MEKKSGPETTTQGNEGPKGQVTSEERERAAYGSTRSEDVQHRGRLDTESRGTGKTHIGQSEAREDEDERVPVPAGANARDVEGE